MKENYFKCTFSKTNTKLVALNMNHCDCIMEITLYTCTPDQILTRDDLHLILMWRYLFELQLTVFLFFQDSSQNWDTPETKFQDVMKIIHKEQDIITAFAINKVLPSVLYSITKNMVLQSILVFKTMNTVIQFVLYSIATNRM